MDEEQLRAQLDSAPKFGANARHLLLEAARTIAAGEAASGVRPAAPPPARAEPGVAAAARRDAERYASGARLFELVPPEARPWVPYNPRGAAPQHARQAAASALAASYLALLARELRLEPPARAERAAESDEEFQRAAAAAALAHEAALHLDANGSLQRYRAAAARLGVQAAELARVPAEKLAALRRQYLGDDAAAAAAAAADDGPAQQQQPEQEEQDEDAEQLGSGNADRPEPTAKRRRVGGAGETAAAEAAAPAPEAVVEEELDQLFAAADEEEGDATGAGAAAEDEAQGGEPAAAATDAAKDAPAAPATTTAATRIGGRRLSLPVLPPAAAGAKAAGKQEQQLEGDDDGGQDKAAYRPSERFAPAFPGGADGDAPGPQADDAGGGAAADDDVAARVRAFVSGVVEPLRTAGLVDAALAARVAAKASEKVLARRAGARDAGFLVREYAGVTKLVAALVEHYKKSGSGGGSGSDGGGGGGSGERRRARPGG